MNTSDFMTILATVAVALVAAVAGIGTYLGGRRAAHGRVDTSEAAVLWQQSQDMRDTLLTQLSKAEEQRDRLIGAYTEQVLPMLTVINGSLQDLTAAVAQLLDGGDRGEVVAQAQAPEPDRS